MRLPYRKDAATAERPIPLDLVPPFAPYAHQRRSFERLTSRGGHEPESTLVTTGTGSGKTECFLYPILDHCQRHRGEPGIKAVLLYPMNALASDQAERIAKELSSRPELKGVLEQAVQALIARDGDGLGIVAIGDDRSRIPPRISLV